MRCIAFNFFGQNVFFFEIHYFDGEASHSIHLKVLTNDNWGGAKLVPVDTVWIKFLVGTITRVVYKPFQNLQSIWPRLHPLPKLLPASVGSPAPPTQRKETLLNFFVDRLISVNCCVTKSSQIKFYPEKFSLTQPVGMASKCTKNTESVLSYSCDSVHLKWQKEPCRHH